MHIRTIALVGLVLCLSACSTTQVIAPNRNIKTIAVISALPDTLALKYEGMTVFHNTTEVVPVNWRMNSLVEEIAKGQLKDRYEIRPLHFDLAALKSPSDTVPPIAAQLKLVIPPGTADAIVVFDGMSDGHDGLSLLSRLGHPRKGMHMGVRSKLIILDGRTLELIASAHAGQSLSEDFRLWSGQPWSEFPPNFQAHIREMADAPVRKMVPEALARVGMIKE